MMYQAYQNHMDLTAPWRSGAASALKYLNLVPQGVSDRLFGRLAAALELISRTSLTYTRPAYGIDKVLVGNRELEVAEEVTYATPFGSLLHFKKENSPEQPRLLLVAPMSGHFATLLRGTVKTLRAKAKAIELARDTVGVERVDDHTTIEPASAAEETDTAAKPKS